MIRRRRAVHVTTVHSPFDPRIFGKECRALADTGWDVTIIAPGTNHDRRGGVRIRGIRQRRGRLARASLMVIDAYRLVLLQRADIVHIHDPELIPMALALRIFRRAVVYDAHEDLPLQIAGKSWIPAIMAKQVAWASAALLQIAGRGLSAVVAATPTVAQRFRSSRVVVVHNYPSVATWNGAAAMPPYASRPVDLAYVGGVSIARGLVEMLGAMALLPLDLQARLHVAGRFQPESLEQQITSLDGAEHLVNHGWLSGPEVAMLLGRVRIGVCLLHPLPNYVDSLPTKLFEYMAAGLPVVASDFPMWRAIVDEAECGVLVDPMDPAAIAAAFAGLLRDSRKAAEMGERGRAAVAKRYRWDLEARKLTDLYDHLARPAGH